MSFASLKDFSRQLAEILPLFMREFARREDNPLAHGMISHQQMVVLDHLSRHPCATLKELSKILATRMSSSSVLVERLVRQGMLTRRRDESDRRIVWLRVTPKGRKVVTRVLSQKRKSLEAIFGVLSAAERAQYLKLLRKVHCRFRERRDG